MPNIFSGTVTKTGAMAKTITVTIKRKFEHPKYLKQLERTTKMLVHDELQEAQLGDTVSITHTRPLSHSKHFYLSSIDRRRTDTGVTSIPLQSGPPPPPKSKLARDARKWRKPVGLIGDGASGSGSTAGVMEALQAGRMDGERIESR